MSYVKPPDFVTARVPVGATGTVAEAVRLSAAPLGGSAVAVAVFATEPLCSTFRGEPTEEGMWQG